MDNDKPRSGRRKKLQQQENGLLKDDKQEPNKIVKSYKNHPPINGAKKPKSRNVDGFKDLPNQQQQVATCLNRNEVCSLKENGHSHGLQDKRGYNKSFDQRRGKSQSLQNKKTMQTKKLKEFLHKQSAKDKEEIICVDTNCNSLGKIENEQQNQGGLPNTVPNNISKEAPISSLQHIQRQPSKELQNKSKQRQTQMQRENIFDLQKNFVSILQLDQDSNTNSTSFRPPYQQSEQEACKSSMQLKEPRKRSQDLQSGHNVSKGMPQDLANIQEQKLQGQEIQKSIIHDTQDHSAKDHEDQTNTRQQIFGKRKVKDPSQNRTEWRFHTKEKQGSKIPRHDANKTSKMPQQINSTYKRQLQSSLVPIKIQHDTKNGGYMKPFSFQPTDHPNAVQGKQSTYLAGLQQVKIQAKEFKSTDLQKATTGFVKKKMEPLIKDKIDFSQEALAKLKPSHLSQYSSESLQTFLEQSFKEFNNKWKEQQKCFQQAQHIVYTMCISVY